MSIITRSSFLTLNILHILNDGMLASLPLLLPFVQNELQIDYAKIGFLSSIIGLAGVALAIPSAVLSRKYGGLRILLISAFLYSFAFVITGFSTSFLFLALSFILASFGFGIFHPISFSIIAQESKHNETGSRMGSFTAVGDIGRVGISAFVTILVSLINWRNTAFVYAAFSFSILIVIVFNKWTDLGSLNCKNTRIEHTHGLSNTLDYIDAIITSFIDSLASSTVFIFIPFLFIYRGASTAVIGSMTGAFFIGNMLGKALLGKLSDRVGNKKIFIISEIAMSILLILMGYIENILVISIIAIALGTVTKGTVPIINTLIAKSITEKRLIEKGFSICSLTTGVAATIAPIAYGFIADKYSIIAVFYTSAVIALCATIPLSKRKLCSIIRQKT